MEHEQNQWIFTMSGIKEKFMNWFQGSNKENSDLADKLHEVLSRSNSTLEGVNKSFEKLWSEINESKLKMVQFSTEVNAELNSINKSIDASSRAVSEMERSMFGNNGTKGLYVRMNQVESNCKNLGDTLEHIRVSLDSIQKTISTINEEELKNINKKLDTTDKTVLNLESKVKNSEETSKKRESVRNAFIIAGFSGFVMTFGGWIWEAIKLVIGN